MLETDFNITVGHQHQSFCHQHLQTATTIKWQSSMSPYWLNRVQSTNWKHQLQYPSPTLIWPFWCKWWQAIIWYWWRRVFSKHQIETPFEPRLFLTYYAFSMRNCFYSWNILYKVPYFLSPSWSFFRFYIFASSLLSSLNNQGYQTYQY